MAKTGVMASLIGERVPAPAFVYVVCPLSPQDIILTVFEFVKFSQSFFDFLWSCAAAPLGFDFTNAAARGTISS